MHGVADYFVRFAWMAGIILSVHPVFGTGYYVSTSGDDNNSGTAPDAPWTSLSKVNNFDFAPGDVVHFQRGGIWRGQLVPHSGVSGADVTYSAYGNVRDPNPQILGSLEMNDSTVWVNEGNNIWSTLAPSTTGGERLANPSFDVNALGWETYFSSTAEASGSSSRDTVNFDTGPASYKIACVSSGTNYFDLQLYTSSLNITGGKQYKLTFRAKCTSSFVLPSILLRKPSSPWTEYYNSHTNWSPTICTQWATYTVYYESSTTASDARITFYLGGAMPAGSTFWIDTLSFRELDNLVPLEDVGNVILDNATCGTKVWYHSYVNAPGKFYYDGNDFTVKLYTAQSPASVYSDIELARSRLIVNATNRRYVTLDHLTLAYGGSNGIEVCASDNIKITFCDLCYIGGGDQDGFGGLLWTRFGNAIELWENAHNVTVENCRIRQVYDAGVTNQGASTNSQYNIFYRSNIIEYCEYAYELWDRPASSTMYNIHFEGNTCRNAGGWGHTQRPDPFGVFVMCYSSSAAIPGSIYIADNDFDTALYAAVNMTSGFTDVANLILDNNTYYNPAGTSLIRWNNVWYPANAAGFSQYQNATGKDLNSVFNSVRLAGTVELQDYVVDAFPLQTTIEIRTPDISEALETHRVTLDSGGYLTFSTSRTGRYHLMVKVPGWLNRLIAVDLPVTSDVILGLINGDCDQDNAVTSTDLAYVLSALGASAGEPNFNPKADLDGDTQVSYSDLAICQKNLDQTGDR